MDLYSLDDTLQRLVSDELDRAERATWMAQPTPRAGFPWITLPMVLFGVFWTLFALFWTAAAGGLLGDFGGGGKLQSERLLFALFGVPFIAIGLAMLSSPYWMLRRLRRAAARTVYVITDRRAIVFDSGYYGDSLMAMMLTSGPFRFWGRGLRIHSYPPDQLKNIERIQRDDGTGDVLFGEQVFSHENHGRRHVLRSGFYSVTEVKRVEELLKSLAANAG